MSGAPFCIWGLTEREAPEDLLAEYGIDIDMSQFLDLMPLQPTPKNTLKPSKPKKKKEEFPDDNGRGMGSLKIYEQEEKKAEDIREDGNHMPAEAPEENNTQTNTQLQRIRWRDEEQDAPLTDTTFIPTKEEIREMEYRGPTPPQHTASGDEELRLHSAIARINGKIRMLEVTVDSCKARIYDTRRKQREELSKEPDEHTDRILTENKAEIKECQDQIRRVNAQISELEKQLDKLEAEERAFFSRQEANQNYAPPSAEEDEESNARVKPVTTHRENVPTKSILKKTNEKHDTLPEREDSFSEDYKTLLREENEVHLALTAKQDRLTQLLRERDDEGNLPQEKEMLSLAIDNIREEIDDLSFRLIGINTRINSLRNEDLISRDAETLNEVSKPENMEERKSAEQNEQTANYTDDTEHWYRPPPLHLRVDVDWVIRTMLAGENEF